MTWDLVTKSMCREMLEHGSCRRSLKVKGGQTRIERTRRSEENFWRRRESSGKTTAGNRIVSKPALWIWSRFRYQMDTYLVA